MANEVVNNDTEKIEYQKRFNLKNKVNLVKLKMLMSVSINPTLLLFNCFHSALYWNTGILKCVTRNKETQSDGSDCEMVTDIIVFFTKP